MCDRRPLARGVLACLAAVLLPGAAAGQQLTESEAITRALAENARLRAVRARPAEVAAVQRLRQLPPNPVVSFQQERAAGVTDRFLFAQQELPISGRLGLLKQAGQAAVAAAELRVSRSEFEVRQDARAAFTDLLSAQQRLDELSKAAATLTRLTSRLAEREGAGDGSRFDRLRAEREVAEMKAEQTVALADLESARAALASVLGMPGAPPLVAVGSMGPAAAVPALDAMLARARAQRSDLRALDSEASRAEFDREAAQRLGVPHPVLGGGWKQTSFDGAGSSSGYTFTAGLVLPLFHRGQADIAAASAGLLVVRAERDALLIEIEQEVRGAHARATHLLAAIGAYEQDALESSRELVRIAIVAYEEGELGILELLDAHRTLVGAELRAIDFRAAACAAAIRLERAVGEEVGR